MKQRFLLFALSILVGLLGCEDPDSAAAASDTGSAVDRDAPASIGLFSPIQMGVDSTEIFLEDYFPNGEWPDSIHMDAHIQWKANPERKTILTRGLDEAQPWLSTLDLKFGKHQYNILVRRAREVNQKITVINKGNSYQKVQVAGEFNSWNPDLGNMTLNGDTWETSFFLNPGSYQYQIVFDGKWVLDPNNPLKVPNGMGGTNSELVVGKGMGRAVETPLLRCGQSSEGDILVLPMRIDTSLVPLRTENVFAFWNNVRIPLGASDFDPKTQDIRVKIPAAAQTEKQSHIRIFAQTDKFWTNDILIPLVDGKVVHNAKDLPTRDAQANTIYFMMVDRFHNGNPGNDAPLKDPRVDPRADFHGGDLAGVTQKIKEGYFDSLGINMLWISPIVQNPEGAYQEYPEPRRWFSGYHGYWPVSSTRVDHRFGTDQEMIDMVKEAHAHGIKVILDYVANHLHEEHPMIKAHPDWKTELYLKDSVLNVRLWDTHRIGTWFDLFMPSLDYSKPEVVEFQSDSALYWIEHFDLDGFRQDATKHIPTHFWRRMTQKMKTQYMLPKGKQLYQIGETFGSRELIGSYVGSGLLDGQFDFNYYWTLKGVFSGSEKNLQRLPESVAASETAYGSHSLMGNITGNHDMPRFIAFAGEAITATEDPKEAGWNREVKIKNMDGYKRLQMLNAWLMLGPGVPVIYSGDEIGMMGAGDPDNRRDMKFDNLTDEERKTKTLTGKLAQFRNRSMAVLYGTTEIFVQGNMVAMKRQHLSNPVWLVCNLGKSEGTFKFPATEDAASMIQSQWVPTGKMKMSSDPFTVTLQGLDFVPIMSE